MNDKMIPPSNQNKYSAFAALRKKHALTVKVLPVVGLLIMIKLAVHFLGWEFISLNALFSGIVAANVFLMGFLLSGVLSDYKESEKIPGELAAILENILDELDISSKRSPSEPAKAAKRHVLELARMIGDWLIKKERTSILLSQINGLNDHWYQLEAATPANFIVRIKQEQGLLRRALIRIHTIRETSFVSSGYAIAEITTVLLCLGLVLSKIDPFYESLFFVGVISFLMIYMMTLIRNLDNPFSYYEKGSTEQVSLKPIQDLLAKYAHAESESGCYATLLKPETVFQEQPAE